MLSALLLVMTVSVPIDCGRINHFIFHHCWFTSGPCSLRVWNWVGYTWISFNFLHSSVESVAELEWSWDVSMWDIFINNEKINKDTILYIKTWPSGYFPRAALSLRLLLHFKLLNKAEAWVGLVPSRLWRLRRDNLEGWTSVSEADVPRLSV